MNFKTASFRRYDMMPDDVKSYVSILCKYVTIVINCKVQNYIWGLNCSLQVCFNAWNYIVILYLVSSHRSLHVKHIYREDRNRCYNIIIKDNFDISYGTFFATVKLVIFYHLCESILLILLLFDRETLSSWLFIHLNSF